MALTDTDIAVIRTLLREELSLELAPVNSEFTYIRGEIGDIRTDLGDVRTELTQFRKEANQSFEVLFQRDEKRKQEYLMLREQISRLEANHN